MEQVLKHLDQNHAALILGYGVTGKALADFCDTRGWNYFILEDQEKITRSKSFFKGQMSVNPDFATAQPSVLSGNQVAVCFHSPGIALTHPLVLKASSESIPIFSELDLAAHFIQGELIGVTGTNGKSTTVKLLHELLCGAGLDSALKGNYGSPLITAIHEPPRSFYVVEESSFQLEIIKHLHHSHAICLNVTDDHFDRHADLNHYARAKSRVIQNSIAGDIFVYNFDDPLCVRMARESSAKILPFSLVHEFDEGGFLKGDELLLRLKGEEFRFAKNECSLTGLHNLENMLAALLVALSIKRDEIAVASYKNTLKNFEPLKHRMEKFLEREGITFIDDSKGTNVGAVVMALAGLEGNVILLAGGVDKGGDYAPLRGLAQGKLKSLILFGEACEKIRSALGDVVSTVVVANMREAVLAARRMAQRGDTVLLSPACSSFDQYKNYHERGQDYQNCVREIF